MKILSLLLFSFCAFGSLAQLHPGEKPDDMSSEIGKQAFERAVTEMDNKNYDKALSEIDICIREKYLLEECYAAKVNVIDGVQNNFSKALSVLEEGIKLMPESGRLLYRKSTLYIDQDNLTAASDALSEAMTMQPHYEGAYGVLVEIFEKEGLTGNTAGLALNLADLNPTNAEISLLSGKMNLTLLIQTLQSGQDLKDASGIFDEGTSETIGGGIDYMNYEAASTYVPIVLRHMMQAYNAEPNNKDILQFVEIMYKNFGVETGIKEMNDRLASLDMEGSAGEAAYEKGTALSAEGEQAEAIKQFLIALENNYEVQDTYSQLGASHYYKGEEEKSMEYMQKAIDGALSMSHYYSSYSYLLAKNKKFEKSEECLEHMIQYFPNSKVTADAINMYWLMGGDEEKMISMQTRCIEKVSVAQYAYFKLGIFYRDKANETIAKAKALGKSHEEAMEAAKPHLDKARSNFIGAFFADRQNESYIMELQTYYRLTEFTKGVDDLQVRLDRLK